MTTSKAMTKMSFIVSKPVARQVRAHIAKRKREGERDSISAFLQRAAVAQLKTEGQ